MLNIKSNTSSIIAISKMGLRPISAYPFSLVIFDVQFNADKHGPVQNLEHVQSDQLRTG